MDNPAQRALALKIRRALLNATLRGVRGLNNGRGVTLRTYDPLRLETLRQMRKKFVR